VSKPIPKPILTAKVGTNADLFPDVLALYAKAGDRILDMTYGKGVFWRNVDRSQYDVVANDLHEESDTHEDFRNTSHSSSSFDMVVLDPPYMRTNNSRPQMGTNYNNRLVNLRTHADILELYFSGIREAYRLLQPAGVLVIKCQDEVMSGKQQWTHVEILKAAGFLAEDIFVLVRNGNPLSNWERQIHARKNHSYFIVLRKVRERDYPTTQTLPLLPQR
jgi:hypothetical protein